MDVRSCYRILILSFCLISANSLCSFPCAVQSGKTYKSKYGTFVFSSTNSSVLERCHRKKKEIQECYFRSGPFTLLRRKGNEFQCVKEIQLEGKITWVYESKFRKYDNTPTMCSICIPSLMKPVPYVMPDVDLSCNKKLKPPPIGCNIPRNCPIVDDNDVPCTGCDLTDDGQCCDEYDSLVSVNIANEPASPEISITNHHLLIVGVDDR